MPPDQLKMKMKMTMRMVKLKMGLGSVHQRRVTMKNVTMRRVIIASVHAYMYSSWVFSFKSANIISIVPISTWIPGSNFLGAWVIGVHIIEFQIDYLYDTVWHNFSFVPPFST